MMRAWRPAVRQERSKDVAAAPRLCHSRGSRFACIAGGELMHRLLAIVALLGLFAFPTLALAKDLALKRVMLSSGGLGYFEYEATVDGDATLRLTVSLQQ